MITALKEGFCMWLDKVVEKRELEQIKKCAHEGNYADLMALAVYTKSHTVMEEAIRALHQTNRLDVLDDIYCAHYGDQEGRRDVLYSLYEVDCKKIQSEFELGTASYQEYEKRLLMMLSHTMSFPPELTPAYGNLLSDLVIQSVSCSNLVKNFPFITNNYPEKEKAICERLFHSNDWESILEYIKVNWESKKSLDLSLTSYVFHQVEPIYLSGNASASIETMYKELKDMVLEHNGIVVKNWKSVFDQEQMQLPDIYSELMKPNVPILTILSALPFSEEIKEKVIGSVDCDGCFKEEMLKTFRDRKNNPLKCIDLDMYYVLYRNYLSEEMTREQHLYCQVKLSNREYYHEMFTKKRIGLVNAEDVIGAIGEEDPKPIFGLLSLIGEVPLEDLKAIISNVAIENMQLRSALRLYLQKVKENSFKAYTKEYEDFDIQYVMEKLKMIEQLDGKTQKKMEY